MTEPGEAQWRGQIDVEAKRRRNVFYIHRAGTLNERHVIVKRDKPYPETEIVAKVIDGRMEQVAVMPSGDRYLVAENGWRKLRGVNQ